MNDPDKTIPPPDDHAKNGEGEESRSESIKETFIPRPAVKSNSQPGKTAELPSQFGRYKIKKLLGEGAMGSVYLAYDSQLDRMIALKVPHVSLKKGSNEYERFYREAQSAGTLRHANICPVYDVGENDGFHYICMAYIEGKSLSDYIDTGRKISQKKAAIVVRKIAKALDTAHQKGIVHRDLKPENILIDRKGEPIITDFGIAHRYQNQSARLTQSGALLGSPAYMSPEQIEGDVDQIGPRSDVYSLGVLFYELLAGRLPFEGTTASVLGQIIAKDAPAVSKFRSDIINDLETICMKMVRKLPEDRYQSMEEVSKAISTYLKQLPHREETKKNEDTATDESAITPPVIEQTLAPLEKEVPSKPVRMNQLPSWLITIGIILGLLITGLAVAVISIYVRMDGSDFPENSVPANVQETLTENNYTFWIDGKPVEDPTQPPPLSSGKHSVELKDSNQKIIDQLSLTIEESNQESVIPYLALDLKGGQLKIDAGTDYSNRARGLIEKLIHSGGKVKLKSDSAEGELVIKSVSDLPAKKFEISAIDLSDVSGFEEADLEKIKKTFPGVEMLTVEE